VKHNCSSDAVLSVDSTAPLAIAGARGVNVNIDIDIMIGIKERRQQTLS
jgi:hypothetical protein